MAQITCPGCSKQVPSSADYCPECGYGIVSDRENKVDDLPLVAIKQTSRKLKIHYTISVLLFITGVLWIFALASSNEAPDKQDLIVPVLMMVVGLFGAIITKIRAL